MVPRHAGIKMVLKMVVLVAHEKPDESRSQDRSCAEDIVARILVKICHCRDGA